MAQNNLSYRQRGGLAGFKYRHCNRGGPSHLRGPALPISRGLVTARIQVILYRGLAARSCRKESIARKR